MLADRIREALEALSAEHLTGEQTIRGHATAYLGEEVDDHAMEYCYETSNTVYEYTYDRGRKHGWPLGQARKVALLNVLLTGMALGKRLGIEDGERFARSIEDVD